MTAEEEKKEAKRLYDIEYRKKNKERIAQNKKDWTKANPDIVNESRLRNKESKKKSDKKYADANKNKINKIKKDWAKANPEKKAKSNRDYVKNKLATDPLYKLKHYISCSIRQSFKRNGFTKNSRTFIILGCSYDEFKKHIESLWQPWMNWGNYGLYNGTEEYGWDIDHIIPSSSAITEENVYKLNHYSNLQPLCSYINRDIKKDNPH
jgi:superfamily II DNA/RNA helicase